MGYRSEVVLVVGNEVMPQFMVAMAKSPAARAMCWQDTDDRVMNYNGESGSVLFKWNWIKWYDSYEEVQAIEDFMNWCDSETIEVHGAEVEANEYFSFIRIGEELEDVEQRGYGQWDVHVVRGIEY